MKAYPGSPFGKKLQYEEFPKSKFGSGGRSAAACSTPAFTAFTEVDSNGRLTVAATQVTFTALENNDPATYLYYDQGAGYFTDFIHRFKLYIGSIAGQSIVLPLSLSVGANHTHNDKEVASDGLTFGVQRTGGPGYYLWILDYTNSNLDLTADYGAMVAFTRWIEIERSGTTLTAKIYTDAFSTVEDTLTIVCNNTAQRYITAPGSCEYPVPAGQVVTGYIADLNLCA